MNALCLGVFYWNHQVSQVFQVFIHTKLSSSFWWRCSTQTR